MVEILCGFDGSCPASEEGIEKLDGTTFRVYPGYRRLKGSSEEIPGKGSRMSLRLANDSPESAKIRVLAEWEAKSRAGNHDFGYVRHGERGAWAMIAGYRAGPSAIEYRLNLKKGTTSLGLYPEYNYSRCEAFVAAEKAGGARLHNIGKSREKRIMWMLEYPSPDRKARNFFLEARDHAYETAGSYCVEGITAFLKSRSPLSEYLRAKFNIYIAPMTNPDGVHNGMSRLTWENGADMNRVHTVPDAAHDALKKTIDAVRPAAHMNIHNWTDKFADGLLSNEKSIAEKILSHLPGDSSHFKSWKVETSQDFLKKIKASKVPEKHKSWKNYCKEQFGSTGVNFEFPWFGRNTADMEAKGAKAFTAFCLSVIEEKGL